ncbi:hypothetical protein [Arcicella rosea]|uniref:Uncharacterized protein n=1 Tax=Arcicella rosea TaxID=502909 RepID=A0A841EG64_9BACT|nr:hypothetical protein [Arcicella rosea]MBB6001986.1 hypothetical protein [Arcicella rosea]
MKIENIEQLKAEKLKLENSILIAKAKLSEDITNLQSAIQPVRQMVDVSKNLFVESNRNNSLVNIGLDLGVDMLLRNSLLRGSSWLIRLAVPYFAKNVLSNYIANNKEHIVQDSVAWVKDKISPNANIPSAKLVKPRRGLLEKALLWVKNATSEKPIHIQQTTEIQDVEIVASSR